MRLVRSDDAGRNRRRRTRRDRIFGEVTGRWPRCVRSPTLNSGLDSDQPSVMLLDHLVTLARAVLEFLVVEDLDLAAGDAVAR
jgi:hypothetical protein